MLLKLKYDIDYTGHRINDHKCDTNLLLWKRIKALVHNFNSEFSDYLGPFMFHHKNLEETAIKEIAKYEKMHTGAKIMGSTLERDKKDLKEMLKQNTIAELKKAQ